MKTNAEVERRITFIHKQYESIKTQEDVEKVMSMCDTLWKQLDLFDDFGLMETELIRAYKQNVMTIRDDAQWKLYE